MSNPMTKTAAAPLNIGLIGLGNVGAAVAEQLLNQTGLLGQRAGRAVRLAGVSARSQRPRAGLDLSAVPFVADPLTIASDPQIDLVIELVGGHDGLAKQLVETALQAGKSVVTANKALLAYHGPALLALAAKHQQVLAFEAAVAGAIPVIKVLREGLAGNQVSRVLGILNGTCNYLLTQMEAEAGDFAEVLAAAQQAGYAEADPATDIDGHDTAHKLAILSALAFGHPIDLGAVALSGIRAVTAQDIRYAAELGYHIKLLGITELDENGVVRQRVQPCLLPRAHPLSKVGHVTNAVQLTAGLAGQILLQGPGAGGRATASAVLADVLDIAAGRSLPPINAGGANAGAPAVATKPMDGLYGRSYLRLQVADEPGVLAAIAGVFAQHQISIEALLQRPPATKPAGQLPPTDVPIILILHPAAEPALAAATAALAGLPQLHQPPLRLKIEDNL
jgi:homoserine dehydrogenase